MATGSPGRSTSPTASNSVQTRVAARLPHRTGRWRGTYLSADVPGLPRGHRTAIPRGSSREKSHWRRTASPLRAISADAPFRSPSRTSPWVCHASNTNVGAADAAPIALRKRPVHSASTDAPIHAYRPTPDSIGHGNWSISKISTCSCTYVNGHQYRLTSLPARPCRSGQPASIQTPSSHRRGCTANSAARAGPQSSCSNML